MRLTANGDVAAAGSETVIFPITVAGGIHQGGAVHFGPDGKLYFTIGETGLGSNAPLLTNLLGKIMRINSDGSIPEDNPFYTTAVDNNRAIWAKGLRNPYTFAFQRGTGRLHINHVGTSWEEVNVGAAGADYGWPSTEGMFNQATYPNFTLPLYTYQTSPGAAITGGAFYNPETARFPAFYRGAYFFGDIVRATLRTLDPATGVATSFGTAFSGIVDLDVTPDGRLLVLSRNTNMLASLDYTLGACCNGATCTVGATAACAGDFRGIGSACTSATCCAVNINHDDVVSVQDIFDYLTAWFSGLPSAEFDGQPGVQVADIFAFLSAWFAGCS
jgi:glucose/arabinose dehydrogenase